MKIPNLNRPSFVSCMSGAMGGCPIKDPHCTVL